MHFTANSLEPTTNVVMKRFSFTKLRIKKYSKDYLNPLEKYRDIVFTSHRTYTNADEVISITKPHYSA
jgi:hypothetical protein